jgi:hypothetical protein
VLSISIHTWYTYTIPGIHTIFLLLALKMMM